MTKELIVAAVLGTALTAGWFIPVGIEASYTGDRVYQSEMISKNDVDIHSFSLLGRKKEIEVFDMRPASLNGEDLEFDISASNMTTKKGVVTASQLAREWQKKLLRKVSVMQMYQEDWISIFINYIVMITRQIICGSMENLSMSFLTTIS